MLDHTTLKSVYSYIHKKGLNIEYLPYMKLSIKVLICGVAFYLISQIFSKLAVPIRRSEQFKKLSSFYDQIRANLRLISNISFVVIWIGLAGLYFYLHRDTLNISEILTEKTLKSLFKIILNVMLTSSMVWVSLIISHLSTNRILSVLLIIGIIGIIYFLIQSMLEDSIFGFLAKVILLIGSVFALIKYSSGIRSFTEKIRKGCEKLSKNIENLFQMYLLASLIFVFQLICISGIIHKLNLGTIGYIILIGIFDWSYNLITGYIHTFTVYNVYSFNYENRELKRLEKAKDSEESLKKYKEKYKKNMGKSFNFKYSEVGKELCFLSVKPSVFQFVPNALVSYENSGGIEDQNFIISLFITFRLMISTFFEFLKLAYDESLATYAIKKSIEINGYKEAPLAKESNGTIDFITLVRTWIVRILLILIAFSFFKFQNHEYWVEYQLFTSIHQPLVLLTAGLTNPTVSSISYIASISIIICFLLSIESACVANEPFQNEVKVQSQGFIQGFKDNYGLIFGIGHITQVTAESEQNLNIEGNGTHSIE